MRSKYLPKLLFLSILFNVILATVIYWKTIPKSQTTNIPKSTAVAQNTETDKTIFEEINPSAGYEINATYGDLGPKMIASGVIDYGKFKDAYQRSGQSLPSDLDEILRRGSGQKIKITSANSYFLLNYFWAIGLNNQSKILTAGDMVKYGGEKDLGNFASTGGCC